MAAATSGTWSHGTSGAWDEAVPWEDDQVDETWSENPVPNAWATWRNEKEDWTWQSWGWKSHDGWNSGWGDRSWRWAPVGYDEGWAKAWCEEPKERGDWVDAPPSDREATVICVFETDLLPSLVYCLCVCCAGYES